MEKGIFSHEQYITMCILTSPQSYLYIFLCTFEIRVLRCLKRALKIANSAQQMTSAARGSTGSVTLFIEILNKYKPLILHFLHISCLGSNIVCVSKLM